MARHQPSDTAFNRTRARLLRHLPGAIGEKYAKKHVAFEKMDCEKQFDAVLGGLMGKTCIDLGANLGKYTTVLAGHCARVIAFEPDPWTAARLRENTAQLDNVEVIEAAAGTEEGSLTMYRDIGHSDDPAKHSEGTSAFADKLRIDTANSFEVRQVDFPAFLSDLTGPVALIKIDIEGAEVPLLETLLDHPVLQKVDWIFCETHEPRLPQMADRYRALRRRTAHITHPKINLNW